MGVSAEIINFSIGYVVEGIREDQLLNVKNKIKELIEENHTTGNITLEEYNTLQRNLSNVIENKKIYYKKAELKKVS